MKKTSTRTAFSSMKKGIKFDLILE